MHTCIVLEGFGALEIHLLLGLYKINTFFALNLSCSRHSHNYCFALYHWRAEKGWLVTYSTRLPLYHACWPHDIMIEAAGHKVAALIIHGFLSFQMLLFNKQDEKLSEKQLCMYF